MGAIARATETGDGELVAAVRAGDDTAFEELYRRYRRRVTGFVYRIVGDADRAEDVTQEAFFSALRRLRATDAEIAFKPWLFEIARNAAIDHLRRAQRGEEVSIQAEGALRPADELRLAGGAAAPDRAYEGKERLAHLAGAFDGLSDSHWRILVLRELEGLSYREIGERMQLTRAAVESTLFRARRRLSEEYAALETGERCLAVGAALARLAAGTGSARDRRVVARHVGRCAGCGSEARALGVPVDVPLRRRVAAFLPLPALFWRRRAVEGDVDALAGGSGGIQGVTGWVPALAGGGAAEGAASAWGKAAALMAAVALAGGGAAVQQHVVEAERGVPVERGAATERGIPAEPPPGAPADEPSAGRPASPPARPAPSRDAAPAAPAVPAAERGDAPPAERDTARDRRGGGRGLKVPGVPPVALPPVPVPSLDASALEEQLPAREQVEELVRALPQASTRLVAEPLERAAEALEQLRLSETSIRLVPVVTEALGLDGAPVPGQDGPPSG